MADLIVDVRLYRCCPLQVDGDVRMHLTHDLLPAGRGADGGGSNCMRFELTAKELNVVLRI